MLIYIFSILISVKDTKLMNEETPIHYDTHFFNKNNNQSKSLQIKLTGTCGPLLTYLLEDEKLTIEGSGNMENYVREQAPWNSSRELIKTVELPDGITSIGSNAFYKFINLLTIIIPETVTLIENYTFQRGNSLQTIRIPPKVTIIGNYAFNGCSSLISVEIYDDVESIGTYAFKGCTNLLNFTIPAKVTIIQNYLFNKCSDLSLIQIHNNVI